MKRIALIITLFVLTSSAFAQVDLTPPTPKARFIWVHAGITAPFGELYNRTRVGGGGGVGFGFCPFGAEFPDFETIIRGQGYYFPAQPNRGNITIVLAGVDLKIRQRPPRRSFLYLILGGGFGRATQAAYSTDVMTNLGPDTAEHPQQTESKYYLNAAIGIEYAVFGNSRAFFEARVTDLSGDIVRDYIFVGATAGIGF